MSDSRNADDEIFTLVLNRRARKIICASYIKAQVSIRQMARYLGLSERLNEIEVALQEWIVGRDDTIDGFYAIQIPEGFQCYEQEHNRKFSFQACASIEEAVKYFMDCGTRGNFSWSQEQAAQVRKLLLLDFCIGEFIFTSPWAHQNPMARAQAVGISRVELEARLKQLDIEVLVRVKDVPSTYDGLHVVRKKGGLGYELISSERGGQQKEGELKDIDDLREAFLNGRIR